MPEPLVCLEWDLSPARSGHQNLNSDLRISLACSGFEVCQEQF